MKFLLLLGVILVAWLLWHKARRPPPAADGRGTKAASATMLSCAHCGLHVPSSEAVLDPSGQPFCGEAHRLAGPR